MTESETLKTFTAALAVMGIAGIVVVMIAAAVLPLV
jgi:hypothetical protein